MSSELLFRMFYLEMEYNDVETTDVTIRLKVNTDTYARLETIMQEVADALEWMTPDGGHDAILAAEWEETA